MQNKNLYFKLFLGNFILNTLILIFLKWVPTSIILPFWLAYALQLHSLIFYIIIIPKKSKLVLPVTLLINIVSLTLAYLSGQIYHDWVTFSSLNGSIYYFRNLIYWLVLSNIYFFSVYLLKKRHYSL